MSQTKRDILRFENEINRIKIELSQFSEAKFNQEIENGWEQLKVNEAIARLKTMPIDTISTLERGIPINRLVNSGFETVYDIKDESIQSLRQIDGIGEISANAICEAALKISTSVYEEARPIINPDHLSDTQITLLKSIYRK